MKHTSLVSSPIISSSLVEVREAVDISFDSLGYTGSSTSEKMGVRKKE